MLGVFCTCNAGVQRPHCKDVFKICVDLCALDDYNRVTAGEYNDVRYVL